MTKYQIVFAPKIKLSAMIIQYLKECVKVEQLIGLSVHQLNNFAVSKTLFFKEKKNFYETQTLPMKCNGSLVLVVILVIFY